MASAPPRRARALGSRGRRGRFGGTLRGHLAAARRGARGARHRGASGRLCARRGPAPVHASSRRRLLHAVSPLAHPGCDRVLPLRRARRALPETFVRHAAWGDLFAGLLVLPVATTPRRSLGKYWAFHAIGFADFVLEVGTGLYFSLISDPAMASIATFPLVMIPLFGALSEEHAPHLDDPISPRSVARAATTSPERRR